jgi:hypothetical protein
MGHLIDARSGSRVKDVMNDTWGHMKPEPLKGYWFVYFFAVSDDGEIMELRKEIQQDWPGGGPWFYHQEQEWKESLDSLKLKPGVYRHETCYTLRKNGSYRFSKGKFEPILKL